MANASAVYRSPTNPHFFRPLLPGFQDHLNIPVKFFSDHIEGKHEGKVVSLRTDASDITWKVKMEENRLTKGWKEFVEAHDLRIGDFLVFRHEGDMLFHVTVLGPSCCEIQYPQSRSHEEDEERDETEISSRSEKEDEENLETESDKSSSDLDCFSQSVTASNLSKNKLGVPVDFAKRNGLKEKVQEIVLMNEEGKSWASELKIQSCKSRSCRVYITRGWTRFCTENKLEVGDSCTFRLLRNTQTLVFQLCSRTKTERMKKILVAEDHVDDKTRKNRFVKLTPTPKSLELGKQHLPASFTRGNRLINSRKIILVDKNRAEISSRTEKEVEESLETESDRSSSDLDCFSQSVTASNLSKDILGVPLAFARRNGVSEGRRDIVLMNEDGKTWASELKSQSYKSWSCRVYIFHGWTRFCSENKLEVGDSCTFRLLRNTETLVFQLCSRAKAERMKKILVVEDHVDDKTGENRFVKLTPTPSSLERGKQNLPASFTRGNRLINPGKITLVDKNRAEWLMNLKVDKSSGRMYIMSGNGWKSFCATNEVGAGESLTLELIRGGASPLLKFVSKIEQSPIEAEARPHKRARWSRESRSKHDVMQKIAEDRVADAVHAPTMSLSDDTEDIANPDLLSDDFPADFRSSFAANRKLMRSFDRENPDLVIPLTPPFSERFITEAASDRYSILSSQGFIDMQVLPLDCSPTHCARKIITQANLLSSVTLIGTYVEQVVKEFYANFEYHEGERHSVYIRGKMFEFTPELINQVFSLPEISYAVKNPTVSVPEEDWMGEAVKLVSGGSVRRWKDLTFKHLTPAMTVLYKLCCYNWLPTTNKTTLKKLRKDRVVLLHMISKLSPFNMGKLIFDQIILNAKQCCTTKGTLLLMYPNLIYLVLQFQRPVPQLPGDVLSSKPKLVTLEPKVSLMLDTSSTSALNTDIDHIIQLLTRMKQKLARGEYGQRGGNQNEDKSEESGHDSDCA